MLRQLSHRLQIFLTGILMVIITLILCLSFWSAYQSQKTGEITYLQRMASLIIYQLEDDENDPGAVLSDYKRKMDVSGILTDQEGNLIFQTASDTLPGWEAMMDELPGQTAVQDIPQASSAHASTQQGGLVELRDDRHNGFYAIPATVSTKEGRLYQLTLFYPQTLALTLLGKQGPALLLIWFISLLCVWLVSKFLLKKAFAPTERMLQGQKDFVAAASHELKSPLAVIMANAERIQRAASEDPQVQAGLKAIDSECSRMSRLVKDMLLLASSDRDQWTVRKDSVDVDSLLITLYEAYEPVCLGRSIRLELSISQESYPALRTDRERLFQILSVYLDNAVYHSPAHSAIQILTKITPKEFTFLVADHGSGVAEKDRPFIFDRFYRADKSRTDKTHFGLGLSIARELSKTLGGKAGFSPTPGGGATFYVSLPRKP